MPTEVCDDGNNTDNKGCATGCQGVNPLFICLPGNENSKSVCTPKCGDGFVVDTEYCDDGDTSNINKCNSNCTAEISGWYCSGGNSTSPSICVTNCSDSIVAGSEFCDDTNLQNGDGCSSTCLIEPGWYCNYTNKSVCKTRCGDGKRVPS